MKWPATTGDEVRLTPTPSPQRAPKAQRPCVFVVEAELATKQALQDMLEARFDVQAFSSGEEALLALDKHSPDVVLLDLNLPGLDGLETCRRLKQRVSPHLPIALITLADRTTDSPERAETLEAGIDDFLLRPLHRLEVRTRVANLIKLATFHREQHATNARVDSLRLQLEQAERLATLGTFAGGVGHELNNVNTVLSTSLDELQRTRTIDDDLLEDLTLATAKLKDLATAVQHLAAPAQHEALVDVSEVIKDVLWITRLTGRTKYVAVDFTPPSNPTYVDRATPPCHELPHQGQAQAGRKARALGREMRVEDVLASFDRKTWAVVGDAQVHGAGECRQFDGDATGVAVGEGVGGVGDEVEYHLLHFGSDDPNVATHPGAGTAVEVRIPFDRSNVAAS